jgi:hypothetical protein
MENDGMQLASIDGQEDNMIVFMMDIIEELGINLTKSKSSVDISGI